MGGTRGYAITGKIGHCQVYFAFRKRIGQNWREFYRKQPKQQLPSGERVKKSSFAAPPGLNLKKDCGIFGKGRWCDAFYSGKCVTSGQLQPLEN
ncbi:unnamed protein product [Amoebophrya sp. A120]|nr:unnamed protein product [Amoebophrya sp. A120]|eukprot:GSA120T00013618001.1